MVSTAGISMARMSAQESMSCTVMGMKNTVMTSTRYMPTPFTSSSRMMWAHRAASMSTSP